MPTKKLGGNKKNEKNKSIFGIYALCTHHARLFRRLRTDGYV